MDAKAIGSAGEPIGCLARTRRPEKDTQLAGQERVVREQKENADTDWPRGA